MSIWLRKIDIKQFLTENDSPEEAVRVAAKLADYIRQHVPDYNHVTDFEAVSGEPAKWQVAALNQALDAFYDYADENRIWCGLA